MPQPLHYEDLAVGRTYRTGAIEVTADDIRDFAARYDPQPFHLDAAAGERSVFGALVASGWLTAALTMRLMVTGEFTFGAGAIGLGVESLRWPAPVRAGDRLSATIEVLAMRLSESRPNFGVVKLQTKTTNQQGDVVQTMVSNVLVVRGGRDAAPDRPTLEG